MGQCYSIYLHAPEINHRKLITLHNQWVAKNMPGETTVTTVEDVFEFIFGGSADFSYEKTHHRGENVSAAFDSGYGYHDTMIVWFEYVAPAFWEGTKLEIWPDEGKSTSVIKNGKAEHHYFDFENMVDDDPYLQFIAKVIKEEVPGLTDNQMDIVKAGLGQYGDDLASLEDDIDENDDLYPHLNRIFEAVETAIKKWHELPKEKEKDE